MLEVVAETTAPLQSYAELLESIESDVDPVGLRGEVAYLLYRGGGTGPYLGREGNACLEYRSNSRECLGGGIEGGGVKPTLRT